MASSKVTVPDIGDFKNVEIIELLVKAGDLIRVDQGLVTVESEKASLEIPSTHAGIVKDLAVQLGDRVSTGSLLLTVESQSAVAPAPAPADIHPTTNRLPYASPSVRRVARELGVRLTEVSGTGPRGRITAADVGAFAKVSSHPAIDVPAPAAASTPTVSGPLAALLPWPQVDFSKFGPVERKPSTRLKRISGAHLHRNWALIPHVTNHDEADITELEPFRRQLNGENAAGGPKITLLAFILKAAAAALREHPELNSSLDGDTVILKKYFHIGCAVDTPNGLVVPVIRDVDQKRVSQIAQELSELARKAREGKIGPADMSGGCFSVSSLGGIGTRYFTPIINAPEVAIMGIGKSVIEPKWDGKSFQPRLILPLSLSWDHRVIDGMAAARFNAYFASLLADFRRIAI